MTNASPPPAGLSDLPTPELVSRDDRIDFLRGLALIVICLDHIYLNPLARLTPIAFGLSDMSEVFLFLSGIVSGWSFQRRRRRSGTWAAIQHCWWRAFLLYVAYVIAGTLLLLLMRQTATVFLLSSHREAALFASPMELFIRMAMLQQHAGHLCILPLYALCLTTLPAMLLLSDWRWGRVAMGALLLGIYLSAQWPSTRFPFPPEMQRVLYYQPLAWCPLFLLGAACGHVATPHWSRPWLWGPAILALAAVTLAQAMATPFPASLLLKPTLGPLRLLHFLTLALLVTNLLPKHSPWYFSAICTCGRNSLATYLAGAAAAVLLSALVVSSQLLVVTCVTVNVVALATCVLAAGLSAAARRRLLGA